MEEFWPPIAAALPLWLKGSNQRLQIICQVIEEFLDFTGRWDERYVLSCEAEQYALIAGDFINAGWRAYRLGWIYRLRRRWVNVLNCADRAEAHWRLGRANERELALAIRLRGIGYQLSQDYSSAIIVYNQAYEILSALSDGSDVEAMVLNSIASVEHLRNEFKEAEFHYRESLRIALNFDDLEGVVTCYGDLAELALDCGDFPNAENLAREAINLANRLGRQELMALNSARFAKALARQDKKAEGLPYARRAVEIYTQLNFFDLTYAQSTLAECESPQPPAASSQ